MDLREEDLGSSGLKTTLYRVLLLTPILTAMRFVWGVYIYV